MTIETESQPNTLRRALLCGLAATATVVAVGMVAGYAAAVAEHAELELLHFVVLLSMLALASFCAWGTWKLRPTRSDEPIGPRTRRAQSWLYWSAGLGLMAGAALSLTTIDAEDPFALFGNGPLPSLPIAVFIAGYLIVVPIISWRWWQDIDEHEADAYRFGALLAATLYMFVTPSWWLGARAGLVPPPEHMLIFLAVMTAWCLGWAWRRYR